MPKALPGGLDLDSIRPAFSVHDSMSRRNDNYKHGKPVMYHR